MPRRRAEKTESVPLHEEDAAVGKRTVERRTRISKSVHARAETVEASLRREQPVIERVRVDRTVTEPPPVRHEGDTLIIPVLEEVAVVERRLVLREEIRIRKHATVEPFRQEVTLRSEEAVVEPASPSEDVAASEDAATAGVSVQNYGELPETFQLEPHAGLGLKITEQLATQINGALTFRRSPVCFAVTFPEPNTPQT
jgi:uncharacterized protein (TIGR02271 family)